MESVAISRRKLEHGGVWPEVGGGWNMGECGHKYQEAGTWGSVAISRRRLEGGESGQK